MSTSTTMPLKTAQAPVSISDPASSRKKSKTSKSPASRAKPGKSGKDSGLAAFSFKPFTSVQTPLSMEKVMSQGKHQFDKLTHDAANAGQEQVEAIMKFSTVLSKGLEAMTKTQMAWAQEMAEKNTEAFKSIMSCKTLSEFTETQQRCAQENFDELMTGATKISELAVKVTTEAFEPLNNHMTKAMKKATEAMAA